MRHVRAVVAVLGALVCACTAEFGVEREGQLLDENGNEVAVDDGVPDPSADDQVALPTPAANLEVCGNDVDDDGDGEVDEDCGCEPGTTRACYLGAPEVRGIGACVDGVEACDDSTEFPEWGPCVGAVLPAAEVVGNGVDDDCDGLADCEDADFAEDPVCLGPCGALTEEYHQRVLGAGFGGSSIEQGDGQPVMPMTCEDTDCAPEQAAVEVGGRITCVGQPPECAEGTFPTYAADGTWVCEPPCELVIHYGAIYGNKTVCAENPDLVCPDGGTVPTWVFETEEWQCLPTCDNGMYDQIWVGGALFCVPC